jgi:hypothetical protein
MMVKMIENTDKKTEAQICAVMYQIQNASNFCAVINELPQLYRDLQSAGVPASELRTHPAMIILLSKINDMMHHPNIGTVLDAMDICSRKV